MALDPKIIKQLRKDVEEINKIYQKIGEKPLKVDFDTAGKDDIKLIRDYLSEARTFVDDLDEGFGGMAQSVRNIVGEWKKGFATPTNEATKSFTKLKGIAEKLSDDFKGVAELRGKEVKVLRDQAKVEVERLKVLRAQLKTQGASNDEEAAILANLESEYEVQLEILKGAEGRLDKEKKIHKAMGLTGAAVKGITGALEHIGIHSEFFEGIEEKMRSAADSGSKWKTAMAAGKGLLSGVGEALSDPLVQITLISKSVKGLIHLSGEYTKEVAKTAIGFGIAGKEAEHAYHSLEQASSMFYLPEEMIENTIKAGDQLGMTLNPLSKFGQETGMAFQDLTTRLGYSEESAGKLLQITTALGKNYNVVSNNVRKTVNDFNKQNKTGVSLKKVMETIADASSATRFNIKGGEKGLAQAASIAAKYGKSMDEVADSAKSLLNFEDSISSELEAELLTGKDLNLERLRYAALTGDTSTQLKEQEKLVRQNFKSLKGNVIAQEAFAKSIGMSVEDVAKMAEQQELMSKMSPKQLQQYQATQAAQAKSAKDAEAVDRSLKAAAIEMKKALLPLVQAITPFFIQMAEAIGSIGKALSGETGKMILKIVGGIAVAGGAVAIGSKIKGMFSGVGGGGGMVGGAQPGTAKQSLLGRVFGGKGTLGASASNPMYVYVVNQGGGAGDALSDAIDGGSGRKGGRASVGKQLKSLTSSRGRSVMSRALRMKGGGSLFKGLAKSAGKGLLKAGGGIGSILGGVALDYASSSQMEEAQSLSKKAEMTSDPKKRKQLEEKAKKAKNLGKAAGVGSAALTGAGIGATIGSIIPGVGTVIGGAAGGIIGAGIGLFSGDDEEEKSISKAANKPRKSTSRSSGSSTKTSSEDTNKKLDELISAVKQGGHVYLNGTKVGTAMSVSAYKTQ